MAVFRRPNKRYRESQFEGEPEAQFTGRDFQAAALALYEREDACSERLVSGAELNTFEDLFLVPFNSGLARHQSWKSLPEPSPATDAWARWVTFRYCLGRLCTEIPALHDALDLITEGPDRAPISEEERVLVLEAIEVANKRIASDFGMLRDIGPGLTYKVFQELRGLEIQRSYQEEFERNKERLYNEIERLHERRNAANGS
jgi:hypothetical protein